VPDIVCLGEPIVDMVATQPSRSLLEATEFTKAAGGAPLNVATGVARLGGSSGVIGKAGGDHFGDYIRQSLEECGVDVTYFLQDPEYATQLAFVAVDEDGVPDFSFHVKHSACQMLWPSEIDENYIRDAQVFHFGTISLINQPFRDTTREGVRIAAEAGIIVSLDPNLRPSLWPDMNEAFRWMSEAIHDCDVLKLSQEEMEFATGTSVLEEGVRTLYDMGPELVAVTMGAEGAYIYNGDDGQHVPGFQVTVADTVGCGDAFVAGMLLGLLESGQSEAEVDLYTLGKIATFANATAALTATGSGVIPSLPTRQQVEEFLNSHRQ